MLSFWREALLVFLVLICTILFCIALWKRIKTRQNFFKFSGFIAIFSFILALVFNPLTTSAVQIFQILNPKYHKVARANLQKYIVKPKINQNFKTKNIVYIYLESFSRDFTTKFDTLTPHINSLTNRLEFTNINQIPQGATVTIEGLFASQCALPFGFFTPVKNGDKIISKDKNTKFPKKILCATQILQNYGYHTFFMKSDEISYQRTDEFLQSRNYDESKGASDFKSQGAKSANEWGIDDDEMFEFAWRDFEHLSQNKDKFIQVILNIGMHAPSGFISKTCENLPFPYNEKMLKAAHCTDYLVGKFIDRIRASKYSKNTIIVLQSDHLMPYLLVSDLSSGILEDSKLFFTILDDDLEGVQSVEAQGSSLDTFTTVLGYMGLVDEMNLGRNVLKKPSLISVPNITTIYNTAILSTDDLDYDKR
ncbi:sulfatase-like hydrolase/transferase [Campylobacter sp. JMF_02 ED1]|uniref:sulfatase-like hydrolase/transferase n=1 Tax=unclassified Campylobacter TaxID=2593542 RepID=UPI0022E9D35E|nr:MULTISPECIES: sulfatase-like hydrolase/transferase [unclassified Campylobacter]MDA3048921.1 sulfatase-like hydrolase/transferase [Campylobacter sp. JMF_15 NE4]MDA3050368.1 sulfatase-like hydrolase/transferase [Campylobacter sp. JMF_02 ED1]MDA3075824.1 sulfatase-like hydrolase/transferase [Campylobacter sp. JMF_04 NA10]